jgi:hypothetical protein
MMRAIRDLLVAAGLNQRGVDRTLGYDGYIGTAEADDCVFVGRVQCGFAT